MSAATQQDISEQFDALYEKHWRWVSRWFHYRLPSGLQHLADDLAQETYIVVWDHLLKGRAIESERGFLKVVAESRLGAHFRSRLRGTAVTATDFAGIVTVEVETAIDHRYVATDPELAMVAGELDAAMERMREASARWRQLHSEAAKYRSRYERYKALPASAVRWLKEMESAARQRDKALPELQEACRMVGQLRGELERLGGAGYRSSAGWPPSPALDGSKRSGPLSDPTVKVCPERHCLDGVDSVRFLEDGTRICRACRNAKQGRATAGAAS